MYAHQILNQVRVTTWAELSALAGQLPGWVFRGQRLASWRLTSTLERFSEQRGDESLSACESRLLKEFMTAPPAYLRELPDAGDAMSWFSLMQHHGWPTRLVDFTDSVEVAAYFATQPLPSPPEAASDVAAIWAVNTVVLRRMLQEQLELPDGGRLEFDHDWAGGGLFNFMYERTEVRGLAAAVARPARTNARMVAQKGLFVWALNLEESLESNLYAVYSLSADEAHRHISMGFWMGTSAPHIIPKLQTSPVVKILLPAECQRECEVAVAAAGVCYAHLFPDAVAPAA